MVLDPFDGEGLVADAHDDAGVGAGVDFEDGGEGGLRAGEGVVAGDGDVLGDVAVDSLSVVFDVGGFAVDDFTGELYGAAEGAEDALTGVLLVLVHILGGINVCHMAVART